MSPPAKLCLTPVRLRALSCSCNLKGPDAALECLSLLLRVPPLPKGQRMALELISSELLLGNLASKLSLSLSFLQTAGLSYVSLPTLSPSRQCDNMHGIEWSDFGVHLWSRSKLFIKPYAQIFFLRL